MVVPLVLPPSESDRFKVKDVLWDAIRSALVFLTLLVTYQQRMFRTDQVPDFIQELIHSVRRAIP